MYMQTGFPGGASGKEPTCQCRRCKRCGFDRWLGKIPWRSIWHPTPVFLPGESHGRRSLAGCSPLGCKESDTTEATQHTYTHLQTDNQFSSVAQSYPTLCDPMNRSTPGLPVHHQLPEFTQTHGPRLSDAIQPSHPSYKIVMELILKYQQKMSFIQHLNTFIISFEPHSLILWVSQELASVIFQR